MRGFKCSRIAFPLVSMLTVFAYSAQAEEPRTGQPPAKQPSTQAKPTGPAVRTPAQVSGAVPNQPPGQMRTGQPHVQQQTGQARFQQQGARVVRGYPERNFGGRVYHGRMAWEGGRWRHEMHNGRYGWWWDVGGVWYFYPQPMDGPPTYVSDLEVIDDYAGVDDGPPVGAAYPPPVAYAPPPPPPPPDPAASAVGGAVVGGLLGGLISGRPVGAAVGAITGGTIGAIAGAEAAARPGYYLAQGNCYYRYPSGQYVQVDPRSCY